MLVRCLDSTLCESKHSYSNIFVGKCFVALHKLVCASLGLRMQGAQAAASLTHPTLRWLRPHKKPNPHHDLAFFKTSFKWDIEMVCRA